MILAVYCGGLVKMYSLTNMSTGQFFAPLFCEFRCATFFHKSSPQKIARLHGR
jgi:hypothetical protein